MAFKVLDSSKLFQSAVEAVVRKDGRWRKPSLEELFVCPSKKGGGHEK